jgi:hypothetical protein
MPCVSTPAAAAAAAADADDHAAWGPRIWFMEWQQAATDVWFCFFILFFLFLKPKHYATQMHDLKHPVNPLWFHKLTPVQKLRVFLDPFGA